MRRPPICSRPSMRLCAWSTPSPGRSPRSSPWIGRGAQEQRVDGEAGEDLGAADRTFHGQRFVRPKQAHRLELADLLEESPPIDRTTLNAWEDAEVLAAVRAAGRRKLVLCALWTEMCIACKSFLAKGYNRISQVACRAHSELRAQVTS